MNRDKFRLIHIIEAAEQLLELYKLKETETPTAAQRTRLAVERLLSVIGEAARNLSEPLKNDHPEIPWAQMVGLRNVLIHEYFRIEDEVLWNVMDKEIPVILERVKAILGPLDD